jgi:hypothetical protein
MMGFSSQRMEMKASTDESLGYPEPSHLCDKGQSFHHPKALGTALGILGLFSIKLL